MVKKSCEGGECGEQGEEGEVGGAGVDGEGCQVGVVVISLLPKIGTGSSVKFIFKFFFSCT